MARPRSTPRPATAPPAPLPAPSRRRLPRAGGLAGLVLLALAALWFARDATPAVPDPTTPEMLAPVREALEAARRRVLASPDSAQAWGEFAEVLDAHHLYPEAEEAYRAACARDPREFRWTYGLAVVRDFVGAGADEVARLFEQAIRLQPRYPPARLRSGDALVRQGRLEDARAAYEAAVELDPDFAMAHRNLGQTLLALDDPQGALGHLERAAALDPSDSVTSSSLSQAWFRAGDPERADRAATAARTQSPVYGVPDPVRYAVDQKNVTPLASDRRAREAEQRGAWSEALADLQRLVGLDPEDAGVRWRLSRCLKNLGEAARARTELEHVLEHHPDHAASLLLMATLHEEAGALDHAIPLYRRLCTLAPSDPTAWKRLGTCLGPMGDLPGALEAFERASGLGTPDAEMLHNWGTTLARAGRPADARIRLEAALALEPDNAGTHYNLGDALETLGKREEALQHFERAAALDPALPTAERIAALRAR